MTYFLGSLMATPFVHLPVMMLKTYEDVVLQDHDVGLPDVDFRFGTFREAEHVPPTGGSAESVEIVTGLIECVMGSDDGNQIVTELAYASAAWTSL